MKFTVPGPPVPAPRPRVTKRGTFIPKTAVDYSRKVRLCAYTAGLHRIAGPVCLSLWLYFPDRRRRDGENVQKLIQDALTGVAYVDDSQVLEWHGVIAYDAASPRAVVQVEPLVRRDDTPESR